MSITGINTELQTKNEIQEGQGSGLVCEKNKSVQVEINETSPLVGGTYRKLTISNKALSNIINIGQFCALRALLAKMFSETAN